MPLGLALRLSLLLLLAGCGSGIDEDTRRSTTFGPVVGTQEGALSIWRGIPFAQPPIEALRWRAPQPPLPWTETHIALDDAPACFQSGWLQSQGMGLSVRRTVSTWILKRLLTLRVRVIQSWFGFMVAPIR